MPAELPFPEPLPALMAQFALLAEGRKRAVLVPYTQPGSGDRSHTAHETPLGLVYHTPEVTAAEIDRAVREDTLGDLLGYGIPRKPASADRVVVLRDPTGCEKLAVGCDAATEERVRAAIDRLGNHGDRLSTETPLAVVQDRLRYWAAFFNLQSL